MRKSSGIIPVPWVVYGILMRTLELKLVKRSLPELTVRIWISAVLILAVALLAQVLLYRWYFARMEEGQDAEQWQKDKLLWWGGFLTTPIEFWIFMFF